jgi:hypothetical protein
VIARAFRLTGSGAPAALDRLHVHADVCGAIEEGGAVTVWLAGELPSVDLPDVEVRELTQDAGPEATGLERDAPIHVCSDLVVRPPWVPRPDGFAGLELIVPRGMAFGSGEHDTATVAGELTALVCPGSSA